MRILETSWPLEPKAPDGHNDPVVVPRIVFDGLASDEYTMGAWLEIDAAARERLIEAYVTPSWGAATSVRLNYVFHNAPGPDVVNAVIKAVVTQGPRRVPQIPVEDATPTGPGLPRPGTPDVPVPGEEEPQTAQVFPVGVGGYALHGQMLRVGWSHLGVAGIRRFTLIVQGSGADPQTRELLLAHSPVRYDLEHSSITFDEEMVQLPGLDFALGLDGPGGHKHPPTAMLRLEILGSNNQVLTELLSRKFFLQQKGTMLAQMELPFWAVPQRPRFVQIPGPIEGSAIYDPFFSYRSNPRPGSNTQIKVDSIHGLVAIASTSNEPHHVDLRLFGWWRVPGNRH